MQVELQVQTLASLKDWEGLEALAKEKKNVLPVPVYIAAAKANGAPTQVTARCATTASLPFFVLSFSTLVPKLV